MSIIHHKQILELNTDQYYEQYGTNFSRIGYCQGEVSHNVGDVCGYEVDANGNEVAKRLTDGKGFKQGYSVTGGTIDRALSKSEYENNRREYGYDDFAKSTGSIGDFLKRKTKSATSFGNATLDEINAVFSGRKFDPNQMISAPILRTTVEEISASATMTKGKSHNDDSQNEAQKKKQEKSTAKADNVSVNQPNAMTNIAKAVVSTANNAVNMASRIGAGLSLKDTINNMGWKSNSDSFGMTGKQDSSSTSTSTGTTENPAEPHSAVNGEKSSEAASNSKKYFVTGYADGNYSAGTGTTEAYRNAVKEGAKIGLYGARIEDQGKTADGRWFSKVSYALK